MDATNRATGRRPRRRRATRLAAAVAATAILAAGCSATGGGSLPSTNGAKKATFGFTWQELEQPDRFAVKGSWTDGSVKFRLDGGILLPALSYDCLVGEGTYVSQTKGLPGSGNVSMTICDLGEPGPTKGDTLDVILSGGPHHGYSNTGTLAKGNLQVKLDEISQG